MKPIFCFLMLLCLCVPAWSKDEVPSELQHEKIRYDVGILWFDELAEASLELQPGLKSGEYIATLEGRTRGVVAFLTDYRRQRIETTMRLLDGGRGFQTLVNKSVTVKGKDDRFSEVTKEYRYDFDRREVACVRTKDNQCKESVLEMPENGEVFDALTALYNIRLGYFGALTPGRNIVIPTMTRKGPDKIEVSILTEKQRKKLDRYPAEGVLCQVKLNPEVFDTRDGAIYVWFDEQLVPAAGVIQNALGVGDLRGRLKNREP